MRGRPGKADQRRFLCHQQCRATCPYVWPLIEFSSLRSACAALCAITHGRGGCTLCVCALVVDSLHDGRLLYARALAWSALDSVLPHQAIPGHQWRGMRPTHSARMLTYDHSHHAVARVERQWRPILEDACVKPLPSRHASESSDTLDPKPCATWTLRSTARHVCPHGRISAQQDAWPRARCGRTCGRHLLPF